MEIFFYITAALVLIAICAIFTWIILRDEIALYNGRNIIRMQQEELRKNAEEISELLEELNKLKSKRKKH